MLDWSQNDDTHAHVVMHIICVIFVMLVTSGHMAPPFVDNRLHHDWGLVALFNFDTPPRSNTSIHVPMQVLPLSASP